MSIAHLKKKTNGLAKLQERMAEMKNKKSDSGETYWKLTVDASGNGSADIRLLPAIESEDFPFQKILDYGIGVFNKEAGKKKWYIHRSLECIGKNDPVKDEFWATMNSGDKDGAKILRDRTSYIVWIYVVKDKNAPENNGKVMKAKLSPSIWKLVENKIQPDEDQIEDGILPVDVFDFWEGATLRLRAKNGSNDMRTYENSHWADASPLFQDDDKVEEVYSQVKGLASEVDPSNKEYKLTYEELEAKLEAVLGRELNKNKKSDQVDPKESLNEQFGGLDDSVDSDYKEKEPDLSSSKSSSNDIDDDELAKIMAEMDE